MRLPKMSGHEARQWLAPGREGFVEHGTTEQNAGCQALLRGTSRHGHTEACRWMGCTIAGSQEGERRLKAQEKKDNQRLAQKLEMQDEPSGALQARSQAHPYAPSSRLRPVSWPRPGMRGSHCLPPPRLGHGLL